MYSITGQFVRPIKMEEQAAVVEFHFHMNRPGLGMGYLQTMSMLQLQESVMNTK